MNDLTEVELLPALCVVPLLNDLHGFKLPKVPAVVLLLKDARSNLNDLAAVGTGEGALPSSYRREIVQV